MCVCVYECVYGHLKFTSSLSWLFACANASAHMSMCSFICSLPFLCVEEEGWVDG